MTKEEFEKAIGREVSAQEFEYSEILFMTCTAGLEDFIEEYKKHDRTFLYDIAETLAYEKSRRKHVDEALHALADSILSKVNETEICGKHLAALREEVRIAIGRHEYVSLCLKKGYQLQDEDRQYILGRLQ